MEKTKYDVDYFIQKFEAIPENLWTTGEFANEKGQCCVYGHCGDRIGIGTEQTSVLRVLMSSSGVRINDGTHNGYQQPTPKQRILAALRDIKSNN